MEQLKIVPKIGAREFVNEKIRELISDTLELQLFETEPEELSNEIINYSKRYIDMRLLILHIPCPICNINFLETSEEHRYSIINTIRELKRLTVGKKVEIGILFHVDSNLNVTLFNEYTGFKLFNEILLEVEDSNIFLLVENPIISLNSNEEGMHPFQEFMDIFKSPKVKFTLDLCHWKSSEEVLNKKLFLRQCDLDRIFSVHFSFTPDNLGYVNKKVNHARKHPTYMLMLRDLEYLTNKGVNLSEIYLVAEICEDDYTLQPDLIEEIRNLERYNYIASLVKAI